MSNIYSINGGGNFEVGAKSNRLRRLSWNSANQRKVLPNFFYKDAHSLYIFRIAEFRTFDDKKGVNNN